jgi:hypothetical protein
MNVHVQSTDVFTAPVTEFSLNVKSILPIENVYETVHVNFNVNNINKQTNIYNKQNQQIKNKKMEPHIYFAHL